MGVGLLFAHPPADAYEREGYCETTRFEAHKSERCSGGSGSSTMSLRPGWRVNLQHSEKATS